MLRFPKGVLPVVTFLAVLLVIAISPGFAQTGVYGELAGKVVDSSGGALPGVVVTLTGSTQMGAKTATTEADGTYRLPALASGTDYRVQFELVGFGNVARNNVAVAVRATTNLDVTLQLASLSESVTVTAESSTVDVSSARAGMSLGTDLLQELPSAKDSSAILAMVAGAARQNLNVGGSTNDLTNNVISNGTTQRQMNLNGAETRAGTGDARYNNYDAYEEINIESGAAGADTRRPGGGLSAELVARTGGNQFHGLVNLFWYNESLVASNLTDKLRAQGLTAVGGVKTLRQNTAQIGGPLKRDRIWWFVSFHDFKVDRRVIGRLDDPQIGRLTPYIGNITMQLSQNHKLQALYTGLPKIQEARGMSLFVPFISSENQESKGTVRQVKYLGTFGAKTVVEGQMFTHKHWWPSWPQEGSLAPIQDTALGTWSQGFQSVTNRRNNHRTEENASLTYFLPGIGGSTNDLKVGGDFFVMNHKYYQERGQGPDSQVLYQVASGAPRFVTVYGGPTEPLRGSSAQSFFVQERFSKGRVTLNTGLRYDRYRGYLPEQGSFTGLRWEAFFPTLKFPAVDKFTVWTNYSPRINGVLKLTADGRQVIKASYGHYPGEYDPNDDSDYANGNALRSQRYTWLGDLNGNKLLDLNEMGALRNQTIPGQNTASPTLQNRDVKETSLSYERELPWRTGLRMAYFYTVYVKGQVDTNLAIPRSAYSPVPGYFDPGPDGKAGTGDDKTLTVYNIDPAFLGGAAEQRATRLGSWKKAHAFNVSLQKRMASGWQLMTSYGWNRVREDSLSDPNNPNAQINLTNSVSDLESPHTFKILGSKLFRYGIQFSGNYQFSTGLSYNRTLNVTGLNQGQITIVADPPGTWRYDDVSTIDIRVEKQVRLPNGHRMGFMLEGYNMTNSAASTNSDGAGVGSVTGGNFGIISKVMPGRTWRLGYRYIF